MDRNEFVTVFFLLLIVSDSSSAYSLWRKLIDVAQKDSSPATNVSPLPSPGLSGKESKSSPSGGDKSSGEKPKDPGSSNDSTKVNPKSDDHASPSTQKQIGNGKTNEGKEKTESKTDSKVKDPGSSNDSTKVNPKSDDHANPSTQKQIVNGKTNEVKEKTESKTGSQLGNNGTCEGSSNRCSVQKTLTACIQGSKDLVLLIQNEGESSLKVKITIPTSLKTVMKEHEIPKNQTKQIDVSLPIGQSTQIILNAENGECMLQIDPHLSKGNFLQRLPSYYKQVTPIYGAYLLFLIALIVGGTWASCKFRKRGRQNGGVPYQELEMGMPESSSVVNMDATQGWDEGWDDDWDEDKAVKSPGGRHVGSISASGLAARSANRDGWEKDWDD